MSKRKSGQIKITLKSDLCIGSGYSYAGIIDSDVCYDEVGLPYIPAKRLKGCLRETVETLLYSAYDHEMCEKVFGSAGGQTQGDLRIGNAYISEYEELKKELETESKDKELGKYYDKQHILNRFTHVMGQTRMKDGVADPTSLRYTRVVNQISPLDDGDLTFFADISFSDSDDNKIYNMINNAVRGTRHIGLKRNRGMGNVFCELLPLGDAKGKLNLEERDDSKEENDTENQNNTDGSDLFKYETVDKCKTIEGETCEFEEKSDDELVCLTYYLKNVEPLMLSDQREDESKGYISGQMMLGCLASRYLSLPGKQAYADSDKGVYESVFQDLFLNGKTRYTNLYPSDGCNIYYPAPEYINRLKKSGKMVNVLEGIPETDDDKDYLPKGNQPKKLKGKFVYNAGNHVDVLEVKRDIIYHHRHEKQEKVYSKGKSVQKEKKIEEEQLFSLEVIRPGQIFAGQIFLPNIYAEDMKKFLSLKDFWFGKSKSAQYGRCKLISTSDAQNEENSEENRSISEKNAVRKSGAYMVVTFLSDAIFVEKETGQYTVYYDKIQKIVADLLKKNLRKHKDLEGEKIEIVIKEGAEGFEQKEKQDKERLKDYTSFLQTTTATGYMGTWNLRKDVVPAIRAGSCLVYDINSADESKKEKIFAALKNVIFIGERNGEGYGQIRIDFMEKAEYKLQEKKECHTKKEKEKADKKEYSEKFKKLMEPILLKSWLDGKKAELLREPLKSDISNAANGRMILMLEESLQYAEKINTEGKQDKGYEKALKAFENFVKRISAIKSDDTRRQGESILALVGEKTGEKDSEKWILREYLGLAVAKAEKEGGKKKFDDERLNILLDFYDYETVDKKIKAKWSDYLMTLFIQRKYEGRDK